MSTLRRFGIVLGMMVAGSGFAQDAAGPKFGFMYKMEIDHNDDGITKVVNEGAETKTTKMTLKSFALLLNGKAAENVDYGVRYQLTNAAAGGPVLDFAWARLALKENHAVVVGKAKAKIYGWEHANASPISYVTSVGLAHKPLGFADMVSLENTYGFGNLNLQFAQDNLTAGTYSKSKQPAIILEYTGDFNGVKPLFQYGTWDRAHNKVMTVGVGYGTDKIGATLDYTADSRARVDAAGDDVTDVVTTIAINADMKVSDTVKPFVHYSTFAVKNGGTDVKVNQTTDDDDGDPATADVPVDLSQDKNWSDNANRMAVGVGHACAGDALVTYLMYEATTGKFDVAGEEKSATESHIKLGFKGKF